MKFFSRFFLTILLFQSLFNPFFWNAKGGIIVFDLPQALKDEIRPKIEFLKTEIPAVIDKLVAKGILKPSSVTYAPPSYESHISLFYDVTFAKDKCKKIREIAEQFLQEQKEPFEVQVCDEPEIFYRFIVYRVQEDGWLMNLFNKLGDELVKNISDFKKEDHEFIPHISISQLKFAGSKEDKEARHKISESFAALDTFLQKEIPNSSFTNSDHSNFFAFDELAFDQHGKGLVLKKDGSISQLSGKPLDYSLRHRINTLCSQDKFKLATSHNNLVPFSLPELLISVSQHWIKNLNALKIKIKTIKSFNQLHDNHYMVVPIPEKKVTDLLTEQLKNLAAKLNGLKEKLKDLAKTLTTLKGTLAGAGAVGGGGGGPVVGATKVDPLNLPVSLKLYASEIYKNDGTMNAHITPFPGGQVSKKGDKVYLTVVQGAICAQNFVDGTKAAIVNAANSNLKGSSGIAPAIQKGANGGDQSSGPFHDYVDWVWGKHNSNKCPRGEARIMPSFNIAKQNQAYWIINCVGPSSVPYEDILRKTYQNGLAVAWENGLEAICFCAISTGVFGGDINALTDTALRAVLDFLIQNKPRFREVRFYIFNAQSSFDLYGNKLNALMATYPLSNKQAQFSPEWNVVFQKASMGNNPAPLIYELTIP